MSQVIEGYMAQIRKAIQEAEETDYIMPIWFAFLPAILAVIAAVIILAGLFAGGGYSEEAGSTAALGSTAPGLLVSFIATIFSAYVIYKLISRRNNHFRRTQVLYGAILGLLSALGIEDTETAQIRSIVDEMKFDEQEKNAILWTILTIFINIVVIIVFHFLNKDFHRHEKREIMIYDNLARILEKRNIAAPRLTQQVPDRSTALYLVLTIVTLGIFGIYWFYTVVKDPNEHFLEHRRVEPELLQALERLAQQAQQP